MRYIIKYWNGKRFVTLRFELRVQAEDAWRDLYDAGLVSNRKIHWLKGKG